MWSQISVFILFIRFDPVWFCLKFTLWSLGSGQVPFSNPKLPNINLSFHEKFSQLLPFVLKTDHFIKLDERKSLLDLNIEIRDKLAKQNFKISTVSLNLWQFFWNWRFPYFYLCCLRFVIRAHFLLDAIFFAKTNLTIWWLIGLQFQKHTVGFWGIVTDLTVNFVPSSLIRLLSFFIFFFHIIIIEDIFPINKEIKHKWKKHKYHKG